MSRQFSTTAQALISYLWGKATRVEKYEDDLTKVVAKKKLLKDVVATAQVKGDAHNSPKDAKLRTTMVLKDAQGNRITTAHVYHDGEVTFSKPEYEAED